MTIAVDANAARDALRRVEQRLRAIARAGAGALIGKTGPGELVHDVTVMFGRTPGHVGGTADLHLPIAEIGKGVIDLKRRTVGSADRDRRGTEIGEPLVGAGAAGRAPLGADGGTLHRHRRAGQLGSQEVAKLGRRAFDGAADREARGDLDGGRSERARLAVDRGFVERGHRFLARETLLVARCENDGKSECQPTPQAGRKTRRVTHAQAGRRPRRVTHAQAGRRPRRVTHERHEGTSDAERRVQATCHGRAEWSYDRKRTNSTTYWGLPA